MEYQFGKNRVRLEGDVMFFDVHEVWTKGSFASLMTLINRVNGEVGGLFLVVQAHIENPMPPEVRRMIGATFQKEVYRGVIIIGASPIYRGILSLMTRAVNLLSRQPVPPPHFVADEPEARALISRLRGGTV